MLKLNNGENKMKTLKEIKKIQKDRSNFEILRNVLECDDNNNIFCSIRNLDCREMFIDSLTDNGDGLSVRNICLSTDEESNNFETWKGVKEFHGIERKDISVLRKLGLIENHGVFFDDGTLHITLNNSKVVDFIDSLVLDNEWFEIMDELQIRKSELESELELLNQI